MVDTKKQHIVSNPAEVPTAAGLLTSTKNAGGSSCIFCGADHSPQDCRTALNLTLEQQRKKVSSAKACFCCLKRNHIASRCRNRPRCGACGKGHFVLMCDRELKEDKIGVLTSLNKETPVYVKIRYWQRFQIIVLF